MLGLGPSRPRRDLKYHLANSLTSTLLGAGQFSPRHSEAGTPCIDIKLRGSGQHFWEGRGLQASRSAESGTHIIHWSRASCWFCLYLSLGSSSFAVFSPPLHELLVPSHSPPPFVGNPRWCVFDSSHSWRSRIERWR